jgi:ornithine carbamoyltransferase
MARHFLDLFDLTSDEAAELLDCALRIKKRPRDEVIAEAPLAGRTLALVFDKPSMRTRVSFEAAMTQLGGSSIFLHGKDVGIGTREPLCDFANVIGEYVDLLAIRTFSQELIEDVARHAKISIINALSDEAHPCQALGDMMTILEEFGNLQGLRLCFVGDGNNVARSLAVASARLGVSFVLAAAPGYDFPLDFRRRFEVAFPNVALPVVHEPAEGVIGADVVYTDVWTSMGQESELEYRRRAFDGFQVDDALMELAAPNAIFLHCLPAKRGEEVSSDVIDGLQSRIVAQAGNRLHFQKALLMWLLGH